MGASVLVTGCGFGGDTTTVTVTSTTGSGNLMPDSTTATTSTTTAATATTTTSTVTTSTATAATTPITPVIPVVNPVRQANTALQKDLTILGFYTGPINGTYSRMTKVAMASFQRAAQLPVDGIAGPPTEAAINLALGNPNTDAVNLLQTALTGLCYYRGSIDGVFGSGTEIALMAFQQAEGITADVRYGPATASALAKAWPGRPSSCGTPDGGGGGGSIATGDTATIVSPAIAHTFDLTSCTVTRGTILATGTAGSGINLGIDTEGGPGAQVVIKGGGYALKGTVSRVAISSNSQFRMRGIWKKNGQIWTMVGTCTQ